MAACQRDRVGSQEPQRGGTVRARGETPGSGRKRIMRTPQRMGPDAVKREGACGHAGPHHPPGVPSGHIRAMREPRGCAALARGYRRAAPFGAPEPCKISAAATNSIAPLQPPSNGKPLQIRAQKSQIAALPREGYGSLLKGCFRTGSEPHGRGGAGYLICGTLPRQWGRSASNKVLPPPMATRPSFSRIVIALAKPSKLRTIALPSNVLRSKR